MSLLCTQEKCDITLSDTSWSTCKDLVGGQSFFQGVGVANNVPRDSLSDFDIKLYCLEADERVIDYDRQPNQILPGNLVLVQDGILQRPDPGITYLKFAPNEVEKPFSVYEDIALSLVGTDTEDGSIQFLNIDCEKGLCDIELTDTSFSTCIENIPGDTYLGGLARATNVPQNSLHDFKLPLYCASAFGEGIDYTKPPAAILKGDLRRAAT